MGIIGRYNVFIGGSRNSEVGEVALTGQMEYARLILNIFCINNLTFQAKGGLIGIHQWPYGKIIVC